MVLQILAHAGEFVNDVYAVRLEDSRIANTRKLEKLRRLDCPSTQYNFASRLHVKHRSASLISHAHSLPTAK